MSTVRALNNALHFAIRKELQKVGSMLEPKQLDDELLADIFRASPLKGYGGDEWVNILELQKRLKTHGDMLDYNRALEELEKATSKNFRQKIEAEADRLAADYARPYGESQQEINQAVDDLIG